jgi:hypothetical protein
VNIATITALAIFSVTQSTQFVDEQSRIEESSSEPTIEVSDEHVIEQGLQNDLCKSPIYTQEYVITLIEETQTKNLNFVELARRESGWNNQAIGAGTYYGIFQVNPYYHDLEDYCDPVEQVQWLEKKLDAGADPKRLFPALWESLYM